jgi:hypothetical protein
MGCNGGRELSLFEVKSRSRGPAEPCRSGTDEIVLVLRAQPGTRTRTRNEFGHRAGPAILK